MSLRFNHSNEGPRVIINKVRFWGFMSFSLAGALGISLLAFAPSGCRKPMEHVTITFLDPEGLLDLGTHRMVSDEYLQEFTKETGIRVNHLPTPQDDRAQFQLESELLKSGSPTPDVYGVDTIWAGALSQYLIDLRPYFSAELPAQDPEVLASYMIQGKLVAMPYHPNLGVLYYRTDLLLYTGKTLYAHLLELPRCEDYLRAKVSYLPSKLFQAALYGQKTQHSHLLNYVET